MVREISGTLPGEVEASPPLNVYLPHECYSLSTSGWLYAIKKQPRVGIWAFIHEGTMFAFFKAKRHGMLGLFGWSISNKLHLPRRYAVTAVTELAQHIRDGLVRHRRAA